MENQELIEAIKNCGVKKSQIEADLGMPKNSLSAMLSGVKPMPSKWVDALTVYIHPIPKEVPKQKFESDVVVIKTPKETVEQTKVQMVVKPKGLSEPQPLVSNPVKMPKGIEFALGSDLLKSTPKSTFQLMLIEFNGLVMEQPPVSQVKAQLLDLLKRAEHPEFTIRQVEAIRERCINYLNGTYGVSAKKDSYNNSK
jgi:hypothetical protein